MTHKWNDDQRMVLHQLYSTFNINDAARAALFNSLFMNDTGFRHMSAEKLSSQYGDRGRKDRKHLWNPVWNARKTQRDNVKDRIVVAAQTLGIEVPLHPSGTGGPKSKSRKPASKPTFKVTKTKARNKGPDSTQDEIDEDNEVEADNEVKGKDEVDEEAEIEQVRDQIPNQHTNTSPHSGEGVGGGPVSGKGEVSNSFLPTRTNHDDINISNKTPADQLVLPPQLPMVHRKNVDRKNQVTIIKIATDCFIDEGSSIYLYGGQVHRFKLPNNHFLDCMLCDPAACNVCGDVSELDTSEQIYGLPFLHSSDTLRENDLSVFNPSSKPHGPVPQDTYRRRVRFESEEGPVVVMAHVCDYVKCDVCSGSERERVKRNAEERKRMLGK